MDACQICLEAKETRGEKIYRFCGGAHVFCETCFLDWKRIHDKKMQNTHCPLCRTLVVAYVPMIRLGGQPAKEDGLHIQRYTNGKKMIEYTLLKDELHGEYHYWSIDGCKIRYCLYENGILHGNFQAWDENDSRIIKECTYLRGALHGLFLEWHGGGGGEGRGLKARGIYQHGTLQGILQTWHENGNRRSEERLCEGKLVTLQSWHPNGVRHSIFHEETGFYEESDEVGNLIKRYRRMGASGAYDGQYTEWYANGQRRINCRYKDGLLHGTAEVWEDDGTEKSYCIYADGKLII